MRPHDIRVFSRVELKKLRITKCNIYRKISLSRLPVTIKLLSFTLLTILILFVKRNLFQFRSTTERLDDEYRILVTPRYVFIFFFLFLFSFFFFFFCQVRR